MKLHGHKLPGLTHFILYIVIVFATDEITIWIKSLISILFRLFRCRWLNTISPAAGDAIMLHTACISSSSDSAMMPDAEDGRFHRNISLTISFSRAAMAISLRAAAFTFWWLPVLMSWSFYRAHGPQQSSQMKFLRLYCFLLALFAILKFFFSSRQQEEIRQRKL